MRIGGDVKVSVFGACFAHSLAVIGLGAILSVSLPAGFDPANAAQPSSRREAKVAAEPVSKPVRVSVPELYPVGAIVIVNNERKLYYVTGKGEALRYGVAVGARAELWMGRTFVAAKMVDPKWIPVNGEDPVEGGDPKNPLGKRALYLDWSLLRIHGTPSRHSIGSAVSNGCIRMLNEDVIDLFERVHIGAPVYAIESWKAASLHGDLKVGEKTYADPEAHAEAAANLKEQLEELARERAEQAKEERRQAAALSSRRQSAPPAWQNSRSALGGWAQR